MSDQFCPPGVTQIQFCCFEMKDGGVDGSVDTVDSYIATSAPGTWEVTLVCPLLVVEAPTTTASAVTQVTVNAYSPDGALIDEILFGRAGWPADTVTLTRPYPCDAGTIFRAFVFNEYLDGVIVSNNAMLSIVFITSAQPDVGTCHTGGGGG